MCAPEAAEPWPGVLLGLKVLLDKISVYLDELLLCMYTGTFYNHLGIFERVRASGLGNFHCVSTKWGKRFFR